MNKWLDFIFEPHRFYGAVIGFFIFLMILEQIGIFIGWLFNSLFDFLVSIPSWLFSLLIG